MCPSGWRLGLRDLHQCLEGLDCQGKVDALYPVVPVFAMCLGEQTRNHHLLCGQRREMSALLAIPVPMRVWAPHSWGALPTPPRFRVLCQTIIAHKLFDYVVLAFIFLNCITIALERPQIEAGSTVSGCSLRAGQGTRQRGRPPGPALGHCVRLRGLGELSQAQPQTPWREVW